MSSIAEVHFDISKPGFVAACFGTNLVEIKNIKRFNCYIECVDYNQGWTLTIIISHHKVTNIGRNQIVDEEDLGGVCFLA